MQAKARETVVVVLALTLVTIVSLSLRPQQAIAFEVGPAAQVSYEPDGAEISTYSWFGKALSLYTSATLGPFDFDGANVGLEMTSSCAKTGYFTVTLYRGSTLIGSASFKSNGFTKATWTNVGSGRYSFVLKSSLGSLITAPTVALYSW